jgi:hypothetical protein
MPDSDAPRDPVDYLNFLYAPADGDAGDKDREREYRKAKNERRAYLRKFRGSTKGNNKQRGTQ